MASLQLLRKCWRCPSFALAFAAWPHGIWGLQLSSQDNPNMVLRYSTDKNHLRKLDGTRLKIVQKSQYQIPSCWSNQNSWGKVRHHHCRNVLSPSAVYALGNSESGWDESPLWMPGGWWNLSWIGSRKAITKSLWTFGTPLSPTGV